MKSLVKLFYECAYVGDYQTVRHDVNYKFVIDDDCLYIYFQGSNSITDWVRNFMFKEVAFETFKVHRGFYNAYMEVRNIILDKVYSKEWKEVVVVGYSHGGALCTLATQDIRYHFPNIKLYGYAFESPRCVSVNKKQKEMWKDLTVIRDGCDIVTHLPPMIFGYSNVGTMLKIKGDTKLVDKWYIPRCIKYHYPQVVLNGLEKNAQ